MRRMMFLMVVFSLFYGMAKGSKYRSKVPIIRSKEECMRLADKRLAIDIKCLKRDSILKGAKRCKPFPLFNAYGETVAYIVPYEKYGKVVAMVEVDRVSCKEFAAYNSSNITHPEDTFHLIYGPRTLGIYYRKLEELGYRKEELEFERIYYFRGVSPRIIEFREKGSGKRIYFVTGKLTILPDTVTLMDLQRKWEKVFPELEKKALQRLREYQKELKRRGIKEGSYNIDFHDVVEEFVYADIGTKCVAGACATIMNYWIGICGLTPGRIDWIADEFEAEWGTDGSLSADRMPADVITAFKDIGKDHGGTFEAKGFYDLINYYDQVMHRHPVDINFLDGNDDEYCNNHACVGVGLVGESNHPQFVLYTGWPQYYGNPQKPYFFQNCNFIAVSTWPDSAPPNVIYTYPHSNGKVIKEKGQDGVRIDLCEMTIVFSDSMDTSSTNSSISIEDYSGKNIDIKSFEWSEGNTMVGVKIDTLDYLTEYRVTITDNAMSVDKRLPKNSNMYRIS